MLSASTERDRRAPRKSGNPLKGKTIYIPAMAYGSARLFAAGLRALDVDARVTPPSDYRTRELGAQYTSGDECYPAKVTVGDFMKVLQTPGTDSSKIVFFMATADGPCRFGQYAPHLRGILDANGYRDVGILSATSRNSYGDLGQLARPFLQTAWRTLLCADILQKLLFRYRPHERNRGEADTVHEQCLEDGCTTVENGSMAPWAQLKALRRMLERSLERFRRIPVYREPSTLRIGVVGEIFCRLNTFSNDDLIRRLEQFGVEVWLSDLTEWLWYTASEQKRRLRLSGRAYTLEALGGHIRRTLQHHDEKVLLGPFAGEFADIQEPEIETVLECARPYLPAEGAQGEMVLNVGKAVYLARHGVDGIIDISPFTCMNGIVSEAIYPRVSRDLGGIPIRNFYFDGTQNDLERDLGVYVELARSYRKRQATRQNANSGSAAAYLG